MIDSPTFLGLIAVSVAVFFAGRRISSRVDEMQASLLSGNSLFHVMVYEKLTAVENELIEVRSTLGSMDFNLEEIEKHVTPEPAFNPYSLLPQDQPDGDEPA